MRYLSDGLHWTLPTMLLGFGGLLLLVPLGYALTFGVAGLLPAQGAGGLGIASAVMMWAQALAFALYLRRARRFSDLGLFAQFEPPRWAQIRSLLASGLPIGVTVAMEGSLFIVTALLIGRLGAVPVAAHQIAINVASLCFMIPLGLAEATTVRVGPAAVRFPAVHLPDIRPEPVVAETSVRFVQTVGGRMGLPTPRPVRHKPFVQFWPSIAWTTLALTINADGSSSHELVGASPFPRHWIYDHSGRLVEKSGLIDFHRWFNDSFGARTPWGEADSPAVVASVESALERRLSATIMRDGASPRIRTLDAGEALVEQGVAGTAVYVILDGMFVVEVDGHEVAEIGPGAVVGERAAIEGGIRTATLRARTRARVAEAPPDGLELADLGALATAHGSDAVATG